MASSAKWDGRFRSGDHVSSTPDPFLERARSHWPLLPGWENDSETAPATRLAALDVACGAGRHSVYLAKAGFSVTALDFSSQALARAGELATAASVSIRCVEKDLEAEQVDLGNEAYDLVAVFFYLHRPLFDALRRCLRPGGLIVYKTYSIDQLRYPGRPSHRVHMLEHNELLRVFAEFRVLRYEEEWQGRGTAALIAEKVPSREEAPRTSTDPKASS